MSLKPSFFFYSSLITVVTLINGLFSPKPTAALGVAYMLGRMFYGIGYRSKGASGRMFGALVLDFAMIGLLGMSVYNTLGFLGYV